MPLLFASGGQINAMVPYDVPPNTTQQLIVQQNAATALPEAVTIGPAAPGVFTTNSSGTGAGIVVVVKPDGTQFLADANHRATAGDAVVIYCAGLGAVDQPVVAGDAAPLSPPAKTANKVTVTIGGKTAKVFFAGLTPKLAGLYQVNAYVPSGITAAADVPIVISVAGASSPPVTLAVR